MNASHSTNLFTNSFFDLNELEYRLLAPRLAFQKLMQAPRGKQFEINGNTVNVPANVTNSVSLLPRLPNEARTIKVNSKRELQYKSSPLSLNVGPLCENWQNSQESDFDNSVHDKSDCNPQVEASNIESETLSSYNEEKRGDDSDEWSENETESPADMEETPC